jgi:hypothetical protein
LGTLFSLTTNIRLGWKRLPGTNTLAYYIHLLFNENGPRWIK